MSGVNPQLATLMFLVDTAITLFGPGSVAVLLTCWLASEETLRFAAYWEFRINEMLGLFGAAPLWNWSVQTCASQGGFGSNIAAYYWPLLLYRASIAAVVLPIILALAYAAWRAGQGRGVRAYNDGEDPSPHRGKAWYVGLSWALSLPLILATAPWPIAAPITIPLAMVLIPICAYQFGRYLPFRV